jgi:hypothetical protein
VEIKLADLKTAKCTHNHNKIVSITWNTFGSGMFIRLVSARNPGNIGRVSEAAVFGLHVARGSGGSVSARASRYSWLDEGRDFSGGLQHHQNRCGAAKEVEPAVVGGDWLIGSGAGTEKVTQFVVVSLCHKFRLPSTICAVPQHGYRGSSCPTFTPSARPA